MKKFLALVLAAAMLLTLVSFASADEGTGVYTIYNMTGENIAEMYLYPAGSEDKGDNLAAFHGNHMTVEYTADASTKLVLEFVTESGYTGSFTTLSIETAPITLLAADALTGPTMISFSVPTDTGVYTVYNMTGENVTELYLYPVGSEDKGENLAAFHGNHMTLTYEATMDTKLVLEFVTESGYTGSFDTLSIETAPITLLAADDMTGPTMIKFAVPTGTGEYTMYNRTGEELAELYLYPVGSEDKGENFAVDFEDGKVLTCTATLDTKLVVEFVTASGYTGTFETLSIETAPITLLSADGMTGPTMIKFAVPEN